ncbi:hypothetical protein IW261DRAFT_1519416 [Armillaria novae-zelandiae]|uniref:Uncharacterized protein n=1 Tax=Armillaria novae-zelandiae TaxID=153914 RepID=A0AA39NKX4_9AGAR|nr:hypothetical protein IW261DRAFT_1519416 [Armillaria novae-zelandiae]
MCLRFQFPLAWMHNLALRSSPLVSFSVYLNFPRGGFSHHWSRQKLNIFTDGQASSSSYIRTSALTVLLLVASSERYLPGR